MADASRSHPKFTARGSLWPSGLGWYLSLPMILISVATLVGLYRTDQLKWAPIPMANLVMFLLVFGKTAVAQTSFYDGDIRVRSLVGSRSVRRYVDITAINCYDNGIIIRFKGHGRIKIFLVDDAQEFLRFLTARVPNVEVGRKRRGLFNTWQSNLIKKRPIWGD